MVTDLADPRGTDLAQGRAVSERAARSGVDIKVFTYENLQQNGFCLIPRCLKSGPFISISGSGLSQPFSHGFCQLRNPGPLVALKRALDALATFWRKILFLD